MEVGGMIRILGIDYGGKRVGVAISDPLGSVALMLPTITYSEEKELLAGLKAVCAEKEAGRVVVGNPRNMDGSDGPASASARKFAAKLEAELGVPVELWDERMTTVQAERAMLDADWSRAKRRQKIDQMAAQLILQSYLDRRNFLKRNPPEPDS